jgi:uncharacterized membrane protein
MNRNALQMASGIGLGAAVMYLADPDRGRRRRALLRDKAVRIGKDSLWLARQGGRDILHRAQGAVYSGKHAITKERVSDEVLVERVRSALGRASMHPGAIEVTVRQGQVTVRGPVLAREAPSVLSAIRDVPGVQGVQDELERHKQAESVPGLQGGARSRKNIPELMQENWTPAYRVGALGVGTALAVYGLKHRGIASTASYFACATLFARAIVNQPFGRILGVRAGRRAIDIQKTIHIKAPVEEVFAAWTAYENFPRFMSHIKEVRKIDDTHSHWIAEGPAGVLVSWDAEITRYIPNELFAWKSIGGSAVENAGIIRFDREGDGTRLSIRISYSPPGGTLGHAVAWLFRKDLKTELDADLVRFKSLLENGKTRTARGERVTRSELAVR